jgi:glycerate kinase
MNYKNILIAPDSFKGSISASDISNILKKELKNHLAGVDIETMPLADGGEGTLDVLVTSLNGEYRTVEVNDPLFRKVKARYGIIGDIAIIEMAEASGISRLHSNELNPLKTSTFGTGEMIKDAIDNGIKKIFVGLGGSATNDLGTGAATVFGYKFLSKEGKSLAGTGGNLRDVVEIITDEVDKRIFDISFLGL